MIYRIHVDLEGSDPPIWRRVEVPGEITLARLHVVLQAAFGWDDTHLYEFQAGRERFGEPDPDFGARVRRADLTRLHDVAPEVGDTLVYRYDFGDDWVHRIRVERTEPGDDPPVEPRCVDGERAAPPEDSGGIDAYEKLLHVLRSPDHPEHAETVAWLGEGFDPDALCLERANARVGESLGRPTSRTLPHPALESLEAAIETLHRTTADADVGDEVLAVARRLLEELAETDPGALNRARRPETVAAGALHAASMSTAWGPGHVTLEQVADLFGVSSATVGERSRRLRDMRRDRIDPSEFARGLLSMVDESTLEELAESFRDALFGREDEGGGNDGTG